MPIRGPVKFKCIWISLTHPYLHQPSRPTLHQRSFNSPHVLAVDIFPIGIFIYVKRIKCFIVSPSFHLIMYSFIHLTNLHKNRLSLNVIHIFEISKFRRRKNMSLMDLINTILSVTYRCNVFSFYFKLIVIHYFLIRHTPIHIMLGPR